MLGFRTALPRTIRFNLIAFAVVLAAQTAPANAQTVAPVLVPYTITAIAGNTQSSVPGFGGEGGPALNATLNGPNALAVDGAGNIYIADQGNAVIRELNAQNGTIQTIAGIQPSKCTGTTCTVISPGCADGVPAKGNQVGSRILGLVVDGFGNVYFADYNNQGVWVIFHGGAQVANFINLVDATGVTTAGGVKPGYIYHIAGLASPKSGGGCSTTIGTVDKVLATQGSFHDPGQMGIDAAGNLYVEDFANGVVRVINTQATTQTILGISVMPGYIAAVTGCSSVTGLTNPCTAAIPPFGGPATKAVFSSTLTGITSDQYGNIYEIDTKSADGGIYAGVAYAGGSALAHLINIESGLTAGAGNWYEVINSVTTATTFTTAQQAALANSENNIVLRPVSIAVDPLGNIYMLDSHWIAIYRVDVNSQMATRINGLSAAAGTNAAPVFCSGTSGPKSTDAYGDGCPLTQAKFNSGGTGYVTFDPAGNLYYADTGNNIVRKVSLGTQFPATATGSSVTQTVQIHFDASNLPASGGLTIAPGSGDFAITASTCANYTTGLDNSQECYVTLTFTPSAVGLRNASLQAKTAAGSLYSFAISGFGTGAQLAVDGGLPSTVAVSGLGNPSAVAVDSLGNTYIADPANHRVVVVSASGTQSTVGTGLTTPEGVAVDAAGNIFIADAASNSGRIVEVAANNGPQTVLTSNVNNPHGLAVDRSGNLYVADTGNARVLEISPSGEFGVTPLLAFTGAQALVSPVAIAIDKSGNLFVADSGNTTGLIEIGPSGGDLQAGAGTTFNGAGSVVSFGITSVAVPSGVAIDAAGNLYVSDYTGNTVQVLPAGSGPGSEPYTLNLPGLKAPSGLALDFNQNLYVADSGNNQVLFQNRANVNVNFGTGYLYQPPLTDTLTVTNIGSTALSPASPFAQIMGTAPTDFTETDSCAASNFPSATLRSGLHCSQTVGFTPLIGGPLAATVSLQGGAAKVNLNGIGATPLATLNLALTSPAGGAVYGQPAVVTLTATQPNGNNVIPSGTVTFNYTVNGTSQPPVTQTLAPSGSGGSSTALTFNNLLRGRKYVITATYNGDPYNSATTATFTFSVPGYPLTAVANSVSYTYGGTVPVPTGTVSGILPADQAGITVSFTSDATPSTPIGSYPIRAVLSGGNYQDYTVPATLTPAGAPALVTEKAAPLSVVFANFNTVYGAFDVTYTDNKTVTGLVNGDALIYTFTPAHSATVPVGTYTIVPTLSIGKDLPAYDRIHNYTVSITSGTLTVTQAISTLAISPVANAVLPTALSSGTVTISAATGGAGNGIAGFIGTPTGTVTLNDSFTPLTPAGSGTPVNEPAVTLTLSGGVATYTPSDPTIGIHSYTFSYAGDKNFASANTSATPTTLIVDNADFSVVSTSSPIQVAPGVAPGGGTTGGQQVATPEIATVYINPILGSTETVSLTCSAPVAYITCTLTPSTVTLAGKTAVTSVVSVSVPLQLPPDYTAQVHRTPSSIAFAMVPFALLGLIPLFANRRRTGVTRLLTLVVAVALLVSLSGCGSNLVKLFTPVPAGPQQVTITGTSGSTIRSFIVPINIQ